MTVDKHASNDEDRVARAALAWFAEPGTRVVWEMVQEHGAVETLSRVLRGDVDDDRVRARVSGRRGRFASTSVPDWRGLTAATVDRARQAGARIVVPSDKEWPRQLNDLAALETGRPDRVGSNVRPPLCLWVRGSLELNETLHRSISITGARAVTPWGVHITSDIAYGLADDGFTVVTGGAFGVDAVALRSALATGGPAVAVLACGVDRPYPVGNSSLFEQVAASGLLLSEWPPGAEPLRHRFLIRHRTIAALTRATIVTEAIVRSAAAVVVDRAFALGRPGLVVPGPLESAMSAGCRAVLHQRPEAILVTGLSEVREAISRIGIDDTEPEGRDGADLAARPVGAREQTALVDWLAAETSVDDGVLDDLVHDLASRIGSAVNNDGVAAQIAFVIEQLGVEQALSHILAELPGRARNAARC